MLANERILYAEDDVDIATLVQVILEANSDAVYQHVSDGLEAVSILTDFQPTILLLDVMMPRLTGEQALERIRQVPGFSRTPAIFMTAKAQSHELQRYSEKWGAETITKPFDPMALCTLIHDRVTSLRQRLGLGQCKDQELRTL